MAKVEQPEPVRLPVEVVALLRGGTRAPSPR